MSPRTLYVLAAFCALLAVARVLSHFLLGGVDAQRKTALVSLSLQQTNEVVAKWRDESATLAREGLGWRLRRSHEPNATVPRERADAAVISAALGELELVGRGGAVESMVPGASHGLSAPELTLTLRGRGEPVTIRFGAPAGENLVFAALGDALHVVPTRVLSAWGKGARDLLDLRVFPLDAPDLRKTTSLRFEGARVTQGEDGRWRIFPPGARADPERVRALFHALTSLRRGDGDEGQTPIDAELRDDAGRHEAVGRIAGARLAELRAYVERLVSAHPTELRAADLDRVEIREGTRTLGLRRDAEDRWSVESMGLALPADDERARTLVGEVHRLRADEILPASGAALATPIERTLTFTSGGQRTTLEVGPARVGRRYYRVRGDDAIYAAKDGPWATASALPIEWRRRVAFELPLGAIEALKLYDAGGEREVRRDASFRFVATKPAPVDAPSPAEAAALHARVTALVRKVATLPILRFIPEIPTNLRTAAPIRFVVETIDGARRTDHLLLVHGAASGARAVGLGGAAALIDDAFWSEIAALFR